MQKEIKYTFDHMEENIVCSIEGNDVSLKSKKSDYDWKPL